jgi:holo-[acyl-carrier protein] synthase
MKSLGKGWREISWKDIEVTGGGKPTIKTFRRASEAVKKNNIKNIHISLSHENENAIAFAISEKNN